MPPSNPRHLTGTDFIVLIIICVAYGIALSSLP